MKSDCIIVAFSQICYSWQKMACLWSSRVCALLAVNTVAMYGAQHMKDLCSWSLLCRRQRQDIQNFRLGVLRCFGNFNQSSFVTADFFTPDFYNFFVDRSFLMNWVWMYLPLVILTTITTVLRSIHRGSPKQRGLSKITLLMGKRHIRSEVQRNESMVHEIQEIPADHKQRIDHM